MDFDVYSQVSSTSSVYSGLDDYEDLSGTSTYAVDQFESKLEKKDNSLLMLAMQFNLHAGLISHDHELQHSQVLKRLSSTYN